MTGPRVVAAPARSQRVQATAWPVPIFSLRQKPIEGRTGVPFFRWVRKNLLPGVPPSRERATAQPQFHADRVTPF